MKSQFVLIAFLTLITIFSCKKKNEENVNTTNQIISGNINKNLILISDVNLLTSSIDSTSQHVDSILSGLINEQIISTGQELFDLNSDNNPDLAFEIIDLNLFNVNHLPVTLDSMAARVIPKGIEILDNSTYGYPDALVEETIISSNGHWSQNTSVLGTFMNAGQFQGKGDRYLGIRFPENDVYKYGWIKLNCSQHNDTLKILEFGYNQISDQEIKAGQKQ